MAEANWQDTELTSEEKILPRQQRRSYTNPKRGEGSGAFPSLARWVNPSSRPRRPPHGP